MLSASNVIVQTQPDDRTAYAAKVVHITISRRDRVIGGYTWACICGRGSRERTATEAEAVRTLHSMGADRTGAYCELH